jgi:hypothetical protein
MALADDLDTLYSCPPSEFLDRRKALAQALRKAGKKEDAAAVAGAAKPTPAAWAVNQLPRRNPEEMAELTSAGERLRGLLRASFAGQSDPGAMADAQAAQREVVTRLARLASQALEAAGVASSPAVLERVAATLTTISTTGAWGGSPPGRLARELEPPGIEALAVLVGDLASGAARETAPVRAAARASQRAESSPMRDDAAEARERIERAEAALAAASRAEEQARAALERARGAALSATSERDRSEIAAREASSVAASLAQAAEEARRKAEASALAARSAEEEATAAARAERAAKDELAAAEKAVASAAASFLAAEEALVRERRAQSRPPG